MAKTASNTEACSKPPPPRVGRLNDLPKCRRELALLYREARHGTLASQDACRLAHIIGLIARMLETAQLTELEQRVQALEATRATQP